MIDIAAIKARADTATAGPWAWNSRHGLGAPNRLVMWPSHEYGCDLDIEGEEADLDFIAHARTDIPALIAALEDSETARVKAEQERDEYRAKLMNLADAPSVKGMSWNGFNVIGDDKSIAAVQSAVHYGGQIDEYRAAFLQRKAALEAERDALKAELDWYGEQARLARLIHSEGDKGRHALQADGGKRARRALEGNIHEEPIAGEHQEVLDAIETCNTGEE